MKKFLSCRRNQLLLAAAVLFLAAGSFFLFHERLFLSEDARFDKFTEKLFQEEIASNTLNLHYTLAYPEEYGIDDYKICLGTIDSDTWKKSCKSLLSLQKKLEKFDSENLSPDNQLTYDILRLEFSTRISMKDTYLLQEPLGPNLGIQAQLPVLLAEYTFRTSADIKDYFSLLAAVPDYFQEILEFEQQKSQQGLFMCDSSADRIMEQCTSFAENGDDNYLYAMFHERIGELLDAKRITRKQFDSYIEMHDKLMKQFVFPAYENLAHGLSELKGTGKNENGLACLPGGKDYYEYMIKSTVGDYRSVKDIEQDLCRQLMEDYSMMQALQQKDPDIISKAAGVSLSSQYSPEQMLDYLQHIMADDFPSLSVKEYEVKYVPPSMEKFSSPAFYLTPPMDTLSPNTIYINQSSQVSEAELFTTLAHEGFPGHLYQTLYFGTQNQDPVRELFGFGGYTEGWATYVESLSYEYGASFLGIEPDVMQYLNLNRSVSLCLYSLLDIGIHDKGWTQKIVTETLSSFGITQEDVCSEIFRYIVENPANYLKYYLGYINFLNLRKSVEEIQENDFSLKKFHQNLLEIGPAQFPVVKKYLLMQY